MKGLLICLLCLLSVSSFGQDTTERWSVEAGINISSQNSLSISIEKEFQYNRWKFGPRIELVNLFQPINYRVDNFDGSQDTVLQQRAQIRIRLAQIEYQLTDRIRLGCAPLWMLGPIPRRGWYQTPTSVYAHFDLDEPKTLSLEASLNTYQQGLAQLSLRKRF